VIDIDKHAKQVSFASNYNPRPQYVAPRPNGVTLLGCSQHMTYRTFVDAAAPHFEHACSVMS